MSANAWFITGASKGFGREWTQAALDRGDRFAAVSRSGSAFDDLAQAYGQVGARLLG
jgi:NAD(P)-dependent dehydrogenase (short-subunit alcohol dehydrogenase family)